MPNNVYTDLRLRMDNVHHTTAQVDAGTNPGSWDTLVCANYARMITSQYGPLPSGPTIVGFANYATPDGRRVTEAVLNFPLEEATSRYAHIVVTNQQGYDTRWQIWMVAMDGRRFELKLVNLCDPDRARSGQPFDESRETWLKKAQPVLQSILFAELQRRVEC